MVRFLLILVFLLHPFTGESYVTLNHCDLLSETEDFAWFDNGSDSEQFFLNETPVGQLPIFNASDSQQEFATVSLNCLNADFHEIFLLAEENCFVYDFPYQKTDASLKKCFLKLRILQI